MGKKVVGNKEIATILGCHHRTIIRLIEKGLPKQISKDGNKFDVTECQEWYKKFKEGEKDGVHIKSINIAIDVPLQLNRAEYNITDLNVLQKTVQHAINMVKVRLTGEIASHSEYMTIEIKFTDGFFHEVDFTIDYADKQNISPIVPTLLELCKEHSLSQFAQSFDTDGEQYKQRSELFYQLFVHLQYHSDYCKNKGIECDL